MMRVTAHPHADELDQRRTMPFPGAVGCPRERRGDGVGIGAVHGDAADSVADGLVRERANS